MASSSSSGGTSSDLVRGQTSASGLGVGGYVGILISLFLLTPLLIVLMRRYKCSQRIHLERLVQRVTLERAKALLLQNATLSKRPLNQQLESWLYSRTSYGLLIDMVQAALSLVSCALVLFSAQYPFTIPDPDWAIMLEIGLTVRQAGRRGPGVLL
jgi:hypothetical protein